MSSCVDTEYLRDKLVVDSRNCCHQKHQKHKQKKDHGKSFRPFVAEFGNISGKDFLSNKIPLYRMCLSGSSNCLWFPAEYL